MQGHAKVTESHEGEEYKSVRKQASNIKPSTAGIYSPREQR